MADTITIRNSVDLPVPVCSTGARALTYFYCPHLYNTGNLNRLATGVGNKYTKQTNNYLFETVIYQLYLISF